MLKEFEANTGIRFRTVRALKSALGLPLEEGQAPFPNQRDLAFLGDAFIELVLREFLVANYEDATYRSGVLRSRAASNRLIGYVAQSCSLHKYVTSATEPHRPEKRLGTLFEATIGALRLDCGDRAARTFLQKHYLSGLSTLVTTVWEDDPVTQVQELLRVQYATQAHFISKGVSNGEAVVVVKVYGHEQFRVTGATYEEARQKAAATLLGRLEKNDLMLHH